MGQNAQKKLIIYEWIGVEFDSNWNRITAIEGKFAHNAKTHYFDLIQIVRFYFREKTLSFIVRIK